jgi:hypothetical protein
MGFLDNIGHTNAANGTYASQFNYVSVDELTEFCSVQLQSCDKQIRSMTTQQQQIVTNSEQLGDAQQALNDLANAFGSKDHIDEGTDAKGDLKDPTSDAAIFQNVCDTLKSLESSAAGATDPAKGAIQKEIDALKSHLNMDGSGNPVSIAKGGLLKQDVLDMSKDLQPTIDKNQTDQSMNMIKVQSAVGQREQMVQLVTGIIQKMNEMIGSVVANIGK